MNSTRRTFLFGSAALPLAARLPFAAQSPKPRLPRKDCFLGLHFDLHPGKSDTALGRDVNDEMVERLLRAVGPDFVQYDCKGHPGYLGFPSKTGYSAPGIVRDSLEVWRRVTARNGVALFIHFSGVWDSLAVERHPEWAALDANGKNDGRNTSTFGPYVDALMIPELNEAAEKYDLDGAWIDGDCWSVPIDYSPAAALVFRKATGFEKLPRSVQDPGWLQFLEINREQFLKYVRHYVDEMHAFRPKFQIACNWLYSTFVPQKPEIPVDFLSGDYLGNAAVSVARVEARYMVATGQPWDLMAWGFQRGSERMGPSHKTAVQLQQEATVVLAQGGGFQMYFNPTRSGHIDDRHIEVMSRVSKFCRERQQFSHKSETIPQVGVLFSSHSLYTKSKRLFGGWGEEENPVRGVIDALVECHYSVDIIPDWKLDQMVHAYPLIVVPDWPDIGEAARKSVLAYARQGGTLLLLGAENTAALAGFLGVRPLKTAGEQSAFVLGNATLGNATGLWLPVECSGAEALEQRFPEASSIAGGACAASLTRYGSGKLAAIYGPLGAVFAATHAAPTREFIGRVVRRLFEPAVQLEGPPTVELALRKKDGRTLVHLANCTNMQVAEDYAVIDFVPAVGPLRLQLKMERAPGRVTLQPDGRVLPGEWKSGVWTGTIDRLDIHAVVAFEV